MRSLLISGEPWFVARDACDILGLKQTGAAVAKLDEDEKGVNLIHTPGGQQEMVVISEPGLYKLIARSDKKQAKPFMRWVTHEVLPSIRKTGAYVHPQAVAQVVSDMPAWAGTLLQALGSKTIEVEAIATKALGAAEKTASDLAEYQSEHDKSRIQPYMRSVADIKDQVVAELARRDRDSNKRVLYQRFTRDMRDLAGVATSATADQTVSTARRLLQAAQTLAKRYGVAVTVQMPIIAQEA